MLHFAAQWSILVADSYRFIGVHMSDLLTTEEAALYLRLSERKLYELVAAGAVPCTKVTGKWLFPRAALDRWLAAGLVMPALALRRRRSSAAARIRSWTGRCAKAARDSRASRREARPDWNDSFAARSRPRPSICTGSTATTRARMSMRSLPRRGCTTQRCSPLRAASRDSS